MSDAMRDPDDPNDDIVFKIIIKILGNGDLQVEGDLFNKQYALDVLDAASGAVVRHNQRPHLLPTIPLKLLKPNEIAEEIQIKCRRNGAMSTGGSINNKEQALNMIQMAKDTINQYYQKLDQGSVITVKQKDTPFHGFVLD